MNSSQQEPITEPRRVKAFASFFKNYMSIWTVVVAALPIPVNYLKLIPVYEAHRGLLSTYTSLFCFLILGFIFYSRHHLARAMFPEHLQRHKRASLGRAIYSMLVSILPLVFIVVSALLAYQYQQALGNSIDFLKGPGVALTTFEALEISELDEIHGGPLLILYYVGFFVAAEVAFILMAIREYLQDLAHLTEEHLIWGPETEEPEP